MDKSQGRVSRPGERPEPEPGASVSGHRGLQFEEPLIFEQGVAGRTGVDLAPAPKVKDRLGGLARRGAIGLPGLSEPQVVRPYTRLSQKHYAIDTDSIGHAEMLAHLIEAKGVSQANVSRATGIAPQTVSEILAGKRQLPKARIKILAEFFGLRPSVFFTTATL